MSRRGFTLVEFSVCVACLGVLAGVLLERVPPLIRLAEKTSFEQVRGQLASGLLLESAERIARGNSKSLVTLEGSNPVAVLMQPPSRYLGSFEFPDYGSLPRRSWVFDQTEAVLVYLPRAPVQVNGREWDRISLRVRFGYQDVDENGKYDPSRDRFDGIALSSVEPFAWLP